MDVYSNQGQLLVLLVIQMGMLIANGALVQVSLFLVITCSAKSLQEILLALYVLERYYIYTHIYMFIVRLLFPDSLNALHMIFPGVSALL